MKRAGKRVVLEGLGWLLVLVGMAALVLPGPGLLAMFAGTALLATQYEWAERRVEPVKKAAMRAAADSVKTWPRVFVSTAGVLWLIGLGIVWTMQPGVPEWWPIDDGWWLFGGWGTGVSLIASGVLAGLMVGYSFVKFRKTEPGQREGRAEALADVEADR